MTLAIQFLEWDSQFFQRRCARLLGSGLDSGLNLALKQASEMDLDCLYYLAEPDAPADIRALEKTGFRLVDVRLVFATRQEHFPQDEQSPPYAGASFLPALENHIPELRQIALEGYEHTRFLNDPCFEQQRARELYATWIENSVGGYADRVLVATVGERVSGFISLHLPGESNYGTIGLVGVAGHARGRGIGLQLVERALAWFQRQDVPAVQVVTQASNRAAQGLYQRAGFRLAAIGLWYHKWFREDC